MSSLVFALVFVVCLIYLSTTIRITPDHQRFAIYVLGQFKKFKGPGLFFKFSGKTVEWVRIELGELVSNDKMKINNRVLPAIVNDQISLGTEYMVTGFREMEIEISKAKA